MRRFVTTWTLIWLLLTGCRAAAPAATILTATLPPPSPTATLPPSPTASPSPSPTPSPPPTATALPPSPTATQPGFEIRTHPDGGLYVGDQVSFEVIAPPQLDLNESILRIETGSETLEASFYPYGIAGRMQATLYWEWNTAGSSEGVHPLWFSIQPLGITWTHTVTLSAAAELPPPEPEARWATSESACCLFYYVTNTAAAREINTTLAIADAQAESAIGLMGGQFSEPLVITLMPRVLGQGGFASTEVYLSFLDRNYAGNDLAMVLHHEMIHVLDRQLGGGFRPSILVEGLAVYLTGGHYKPEALLPRAAALLPPSGRADSLGLGWYIPLRELSADFYQSQHEIGYIQAGALVEYLAGRWGWEAFWAFYRDIHPVEGGSQADALDAALQAHFGLGLEALEADFVARLAAEPVSLTVLEDVSLTVDFFEAMRRYQLLFDPSAHFLTAWLPNGPVLRERGLVADLVRRPRAVENQALELLLAAADAAMDASDLDTAREALAALHVVLDAVEAGETAPFAAHPLAETYYDITQQAAARGYAVERIEFEGETARVVASRGWAALEALDFVFADGRWQPDGGG